MEDIVVINGKNYVECVAPICGHMFLDTLAYKSYAGLTNGSYNNEIGVKTIFVINEPKWKYGDFWYRSEPHEKIKELNANIKINVGTKHTNIGDMIYIESDTFGKIYLDKNISVGKAKIELHNEESDGSSVKAIIYSTYGDQKIEIIIYTNFIRGGNKVMVIKFKYINNEDQQ